MSHWNDGIDSASSVVFYHNFSIPLFRVLRLSIFLARCWLTCLMQLCASIHSAVRVSTGEADEIDAQSLCGFCVRTRRHSLAMLHEDCDGGGAVAGQDQEGALLVGEECKAEVERG